MYATGMKERDLPERRLKENRLKRLGVDAEKEQGQKYSVWVRLAERFFRGGTRDPKAE